MELWYPITAACPPLRAAVMGIVRSGAIDAHLIVSRGRSVKGDIWVELDKRGKIKREVEPPLAWRPQWPEKWTAPLPDPLITCSPQMATERFRMQSVEDAEAAELAREMESDRADARRGTGTSETRERLPWWRDGSLIRYETPGSITPKMAEGRIMRAVALSGHGMDIAFKARTVGTILADIASRAEAEAYATSDYVPRLRALPADHEDFLTAIGWFVELDDGKHRAWGFARSQRILIRRSFDIPLSYAVIGDMEGVSGTRIQQIYDATMRRVVTISNSGNAQAEYQIAQAQHRNRAWKRKHHDPARINEDALAAMPDQTLEIP